MSNIRQSLDQSILPHAPNLLVTSADIAAHARDKGIPHRDITEADVLTNRIANFKKDVPKSDQFRQALQKNQQVAESELVVPLLARLLVFQRYITTLSNMGENLHKMDHKRRWLHLQLHPHLLNSNGSGEGDLFDQICGDLNALFERQNLHLSQKNVIIRRLSKEILDCVRKTIGLDQEAMPIYFVIDECQFSVTDMEDLFRSADWTTKRGILRELARSWDKTLNHTSGLGIVSSAFIFTGTGLSRELISDVISSVVVKTQFLTSVYDTGAFDDPETQAAYLERFFPSDIWKNSGLLGDRIYYWLRGRQVIVPLQLRYTSCSVSHNMYIDTDSPRNICLLCYNVDIETCTSSWINTSVVWLAFNQRIVRVPKKTFLESSHCPDQRLDSRTSMHE